MVQNTHQTTQIAVTHLCWTQNKAYCPGVTSSYAMHQYWSVGRHFKLWECHTWWGAFEVPYIICTSQSAMHTMQERGNECHQLPNRVGLKRSMFASVSVRVVLTVKYIHVSELYFGTVNPWVFVLYFKSIKCCIVVEVGKHKTCIKVQTQFVASVCMELEARLLQYLKCVVQSVS